MEYKRNRFIDIMRGIAMLLVALGHTISGCTADYECSVLYNIVWSLQMPLFILISGYVTRYGQKIVNVKQLLNYIKRRSISYLIPWAIWSLLIRGILLNQPDFLNIRWLLWHMDSGYWFLTTIWIISVIYGVSSFVSNQIIKNSNILRQVLILTVYIIGMILLVIVGRIVGFSFFAIKLILYYMPFYFAGYLYGQFKDKILSNGRGKAALNIGVAACTSIWIITITRYSLYELQDSIIAIIIRGMSSLTGCVAICGLLNELPDDVLLKNVCIKMLHWCGEHSLEIYVSHYLFLNLLRITPSPVFRSIQGITLVGGNYIITILITLFIVYILNLNMYLRWVLFGKRKL